MGYKIGTLSLSTSERHPLGKQQPIEIAFPFPILTNAQIRLSISDDHLGVILFSNLRPMPHSEIWVWNWKTGQLKLVGTSCMVQLLYTHAYLRLHRTRTLSFRSGV